MRQAVTDWPAAQPGTDPSAQRLENVFSNCQSELLGMLFYQLGDLEEARQTLQDAYVVCWRQRVEGPAADNPRPWVFQIAHDVGRNRQSAARLRTQPRARRHSPRLAEPSVESAHDIPRTKATEHEAIERLRAAITQLPREEQEVFLLRQNGQADYEQIAESLGIPVRAVKTRMRLALAKLRKVLDVG